ncbi:MAG TPA: hypothetical protein VHU79_07970 [Sphingomicrobium sp.]|nr:hypothetical protein [Sphingomicrobium sp.]
MVSGSSREVALDPSWLPHTYDQAGSNLTSVFVTREDHGRLMFLSDEHFKDEFRKVTYPASEVAAHLREAPRAPIHFIFHTSFCCSTLMLRALDVPGRAFGLREPDVLINLANRFIRSDDASNRERLRLVLSLLARPFEAGESIIVKPTNFANRLALPTLELSPESRAVLLYSDARTLLRSILKRGMWGRIWGRKLYQSAALWSSLDFGFSPEEAFVLTDLQALGLGWLMQMHQFGELARRMGEKVAIVDSADFLADPARTLQRISRLFELKLDQSAIDEVVNGPTFARHSKFSERGYGRAERTADHRAAEAAHHEELEMVVKWVETVAAHMNVDLRPASTHLERAV